ncbi:hypothetical protein PoB_003858600 [Plakobranchus ocellatus]|uniref:Uncharacterized protein n=1 Tax=Plakobranchus ocellatus TaxID=259542 RepID=A0AAV4AVC3_9GAST|nr:hypothetical protein PoB_003858600 [Plakobranchus ocellatus]
MKVAANLASFRTKENIVFPSMYCWTHELLPPVCSRPKGKGGPLKSVASLVTQIIKLTFGWVKHPVISSALRWRRDEPFEIRAEETSDT